MFRRSTYLLLTAWLAVFTANSVCGQATKNPEPTYQGKSLSFWIGQLKAEEDDLRSQASKILGGVGPADKAAVPILITALDDPYYIVRRAASGALVRIGPGAVPELISAFNSKDPDTFTEIAKILKRMGSAAVPSLIEGLGKSKDAQFKIGSIIALEFIGPEAKAAVPALLNTLMDENEAVRKTAARTLKNLDPEAAKKAGE